LVAARAKSDGLHASQIPDPHHGQRVVMGQPPHAGGEGIRFESSVTQIGQGVVDGGSNGSWR